MKEINSGNVAHKKLPTEPTIKKRKVDESKKEKASKKASRAPKRPISAFLVFMEHFRKSYKENFPDNKSVSAVTKAGGQKWSSMPDAEKHPYLMKAAKKKQEYEVAMEEFHKQNLIGIVGVEAPEESGKSSGEVHDEAEQEASS